MTNQSGQQTGAGENAPLFSFFALVFALSLPFWLISAIAKAELMPGLPLAGLMFICPALAALILRYRADGLAGAGSLLARAFDIKRTKGPGFIALIALFNPILFAAAHLIQGALGVDLPAPHISLATTLVLSALFFFAALGEELGWTGYAIEPMQRRWGVLGAALLLGAIWSAWHFVALLQAGRSLEWIAWWTLWTVAARVIMVWSYNRAGKSVFGAALYHAMSNMCWQLYPERGSFFDPAVSGPVTAAVAFALFAFWRPARS